MRSIAVLRALQLRRMAIKLNDVNGSSSLSAIPSPIGKSSLLYTCCYNSGEARHVEEVGQEARLGQEWLSKSSWKDCEVQVSSGHSGILTGGSVTDEVDEVEGEVTEVSSGDEEAESDADESRKGGSLSGKGGGALRFGEIVGNGRSSSGGSGLGKKKGKSKVNWVCSECGHSEGQWWGSCKECSAVGSLKKFLEDGGEKNERRRSWLPQRGDEAQPVKITDVNRKINHLEWRIPL